jgi:KDO2-lipid IV(A) lauroyltransferase
MTDAAGSAGAARLAASRGTTGQRVRARFVAGLSRVIRSLPEGPVDSVADLAGELWYRLAPSRASLGRRNLQRVVRYLSDQGRGDAPVRAAATDGAALERLLRMTFRQATRYYVDLMRLPGRTSADVDRRLAVETSELVTRAFGPDAPVVLAAMHYGEVEFPAMLAAARSGARIRAPMETIGDPALQDWIRRTRSSVGVEVVPLRNARRSLLEALSEGRSIGLVADRNVAGGVLTLPFFGTSAPLPMGPALLAVESGRPLYLAAVRRTSAGHYSGSLTPVAVPADGPRRERVETAMTNLVAAMESQIARAPEQWWSLLSPIWPDLDPRAATGTGHLEPETAAPA